MLTKCRLFFGIGWQLIFLDLVTIFYCGTQYSQTCVQRPPLGPEKCGRYAEGCLKKITGK
jgi:hypothetical protein